MSPLSSDLRNILERAIIRARDVAEGAAKAALIALAVRDDDLFTSISDEQRSLREALRVKVRQLSGGNDDQDAGFRLLVEEVAYEQWHKRLFARFLAENGLLMHPEGVAVSLEECSELAAAEEGTDAWQLAVRYASLMLPGIFRADDYVEQVQLSLEGRQELEHIVMELPSALFIADDTLGWVYQFWQKKRKEEVNKSGRKIGGADLSPVTQLFTEHYMVQFLLENSLGAWWAARHPTSPLLQEFTYLRFTDDGIPAAGTFAGWPERVAEVTVMDPCCGSGHFLVAAFEMLFKMRMEEEGHSEAATAAAVLRDNLFGLELDERCTQIAAFALAFAAWKTVGYRELPIPNIACSGIAVTGQLETWTSLAGDDKKLRFTLEHHYNLFREAPDLGSLIDPNDVPIEFRLFYSDYDEVEPLLKLALEREKIKNDPTAAVFGAAAEGVAKAARFLVRTYTLVVTNVPYLQRGKQNEILKKFCDTHHPDAKTDIATAFIERCQAFTGSGGSYALVTPQNWRSLGSYTDLRKKLLLEQTWNMVINLGSKAFQTPMWDFNIGFSTFTNLVPDKDQIIVGIDASTYKAITEKADHLSHGLLYTIAQSAQLQNPDARITLIQGSTSALLATWAYAYKGITTGDDLRFKRNFWEFQSIPHGWLYLQSSVKTSTAYSGREAVLWFDALNSPTHKGAYIRAMQIWGKKGVLVSLIGHLPVTLYSGEAFDTNCSPIIPNNPSLLPAIWAFCQSLEFNKAVRRINQKLSVADATLVKVPFDLEYWQKVADEAGPLPEPYSDDPTQWLFNGNPVDSTQPLQIAVARLLDYSWPQQKADMLDAHTEKESIICLPAVAGEDTAVERLRALLALAYGDAWSSGLQERLLAEVGFAGKSLDNWLRNGFFQQHCKLFHHRPFIWHIWDEQSDGFSAFVNYHQFDAAGLAKLTYTYLGSWITMQKAEKEANVAGAERRYLAAVTLQNKLQEIRDGEKPYDIYVRWKQLHEQPIGWQPDINDGVRINIRPFVEAGILRNLFTINWNKDRGTNPDGTERFNDVHTSLAEKHDAQPKTIEWI
jgi:N-6 DNA Methylase